LLIYFIISSIPFTLIYGSPSHNWITSVFIKWTTTRKAGGFLLHQRQDAVSTSLNFSRSGCIFNRVDMPDL
jgi:hypothetical protein